MKLYCCSTPKLTFGWELGASTDAMVIRFHKVYCVACGRRYLFLDDEGDFQEQTIVDVFVEERVRAVQG